MKSKIILTIATSVLLIFGSCTKVLDLEPAQNLSNDVALSSDVSVKQVLVGAYDAISTSSLYGGNTFRNAELYGGEGEIIWLGTYVGPKEIFLRQILVTNDDVVALWTDAYFCINICNNVLSALTVVNEADRNRVEGEAKFLRACVYFELVRFFGQQYEAGQNNSQLAVPLILTPTQTLADNSTIARNNVEECYAQIISDLTDAENLLPVKNGNYATSNAASAILSRVYLQQNDYANARDNADKVIGSGTYSMVTNYIDEFGQDNNTKEDIFAIQNSEQDGNNSMNTYFSTAANGGRGDVQIEQSFYDLFDPTDIRRTLYYKNGGKWRSGKYNNQFGNLAVVRLAEMYLIRAECNERLGTSVGAAAVDDYNVTHVRAGLPAALSVTLDDIIFERRLELAQEGIKVHDVKRMHGTIGTMAYNDVKMVFPIPQRDIEINPNLIQNPGY
jgi:hypothetical protein